MMIAPRQSLLIGCFEPPAFGGASTSAYQLYRALAGAFDARYLNLVQSGHIERLRASLGDDLLNPEKLDDVHSYVLEEPPFPAQPGLPAFLDELNPYLLVGVGYIAAYILKKARPDLPMILITTGCQQVKDALREGTLQHVQELLAGDTPVRISNDIESAALAQADVVVTHSEMIRQICGICYPEHGARVHRHVLWFYDWIHGAAARNRSLSRRFEERDIDILFVASDWERVEKNFPLVKELAARFADRSVHVVGYAPEAVAGARHHGLVPHRRALELLGRARVLVCPSRFDAAPGILFEGAALGCNLVTSRNCGNHDLCHPSLLAEDCSVGSFTACIERALQRPLTANTGFFERSNSMKQLIALFEEYIPRRLVPTATSA